MLSRSHLIGLSIWYSIFDVMMSLCTAVVFSEIDEIDIHGMYKFLEMQPKRS